ncbi:MAG: ABC transporter ATP-binding protein [Eubacteriales bacterium]
MIQVQNLTKRYGNQYALSDVSFTVGEGEIVGLLGPNGAGKSTTMNILTGYLSATSGKVVIGGVDVLDHPLAAKAQIGYLPEQPPVYPEMTVEEYLQFAYELRGCTLNRRAHLDEICEVVKLGEVRQRLIRNLSKGYRQRLGIAQALVGDPKILIFDEPTIGLDPKQIIEVRGLLRTLGKRHTVVLSTHVLAEVQAVCGRVLIINRGKLIADEQTDNLTRAIADNTHYRYSIGGPKKEVLATLRGTAGVLSADAADQRDGEAEVYLVQGAKGTDCRKDVFYSCAKKGYPIVGVTGVGTDLESVFIRLVDRANAQSKP